ncbi:C10 family peptidase [Maribellus mangrovi]|uniref:C10 family peptidase n=1 Tax=Maribellus mangrovi TaxID=3133146 RepID=UPI0030EB69A5
MTTKNYLFVLIIILFFGCSKEQLDLDLNAIVEPKNNINESDGLSQEYHNAVDLVNHFYDQVNIASEIKSTKISDLSLTNMETLHLQTFNTKSAEETIIDSINIYTFDLDIDGESGFVIASGDDRVGRVYAFVKSGALADTAHIEGMAQMVRNIPKLCKHDIEVYNSGAITTKSTLTSFVYGPYIETRWNQDEPYNYGSPTNGSCTNMDYYYAGCGVIAMAQTIAYYGKCSQSYDFSALTAQNHITIWSSEYLQSEVSSYIAWLGSYANIRADYDCEGTSSKIGNCNNVLKNMGYSRHYETTNDVSDSRLYNSVKTQNVVLTRGSTASVGHMWIFDGLTGQANSDGSLSSIATVHCNWGWGGSCNGWYAAYNNMYNEPSYSASDNDPNDGADDPGIYNFYKDNAYIYITE